MKKNNNVKYVLVSGSVLSGIGKGVVSASIGKILKYCLGCQVTMIKMDPYLNLNAAHLGPSQHGETFVCRDGTETDLDLGTYERELDICLTGKHNITGGKIFSQVLYEEMHGNYLGETVTYSYHVAGEILKWIQRVVVVSESKSESESEAPLVVILEMGGSIGDLESMVFWEAMKQLQFHLSSSSSSSADSIFHVHVSFIPIHLGEPKTKPLTKGIAEVRSLGLAPDLVVVRSESLLRNIGGSLRSKIAQGTLMPRDRILFLENTNNLFSVPFLFLDQGTDRFLSQWLGIPAKEEEEKTKTINDPFTPIMLKYASLSSSSEPVLKIALVGKYTKCKDAYLSLEKAILHAAMSLNQHVVLKPVDPEETTTPESIADWCDGLIVPGGFGTRAVEQTIAFIEWSRVNRTPFFGICLGLQLAILEYARNVLNLMGANSAEFDTDSEVRLLPPGTSRIDWIVPVSSVDKKMHSGLRSMSILPKFKYSTKTITQRCFGGGTVREERHRHRYQLDETLIPILAENSFQVTAVDTETKTIAEVMEMVSTEHPFYLGVQFHPEFETRLENPSPWFVEFLQACLEKKKKTSDQKIK